MGITTCADCQIPLVEERDVCRDCGTVNIKHEVCQTCGRVYHEGYRCFNHMEKVARYVCVVCGFQLCKKCVKKRNGRYVCAKHADIQMDDNDFVQLYSTHSIIEAEFLENLLGEKDIECQALTFQKFTTRDADSDPQPWYMPSIRIFVPKGNFLEADRLINSLYHCGHCSVLCLPEDDRCYNCGERFE